MNVIKADITQPILLGRQGEHGATQVVFDLSGYIRTYGDGVAQLAVKRPGDPVEYAAVLTQEGDKATWEIGPEWTAIHGQGYCYLHWFVDDDHAKTDKYKTLVQESKSACVDVPEPQAGYLDQVLSAGASAVKACQETKAVAQEVAQTAKRFDEVVDKTVASMEKTVEQAEGYTSHPPIIGENGNWWEWDGDTYADTGKPSRGEKGETGGIGPVGPQGERGLRGEKGDTGAVGPQGPQGERGPQGEIGPQGKQGPKGDPGASVEVLQGAGYSETAVMSQKAVTDMLGAVVEADAAGNLFNKNSDKNRDGYILQSYQNSYTAISGFTVTHPILAKAGAYTFHTKQNQLGGNALFVAPCDENGTILANTVQAQDNGDNTATITIGNDWAGTHFAVNVYNKDINTFMVVAGDTMPSEYLEYSPNGTYKLKADALLQNEPLFGKKIALNGDSICFGAGSTGGYGKILADKYGMTLQNIAMSGGTIAAETYASDGVTARHWICRTIANMAADADYAIVEGGLNDASVKPPLGAITSGLNATLDDTTFYGAFESMCKQLTLRFAGKKIGYIMVHQAHPDFSSTGTDNYYWAAKRCCEKWGVPFLDLSVSCPPFGLIYPSNTEMYPLRETYTYSADGWHPNEEGYRKFYVPKIEAWLKTL